jgi:hypothetical protein
MQDKITTKTANRCFGNMENLKYLGIMLTN